MSHYERHRTASIREFSAPQAHGKRIEPTLKRPSGLTPRQQSLHDLMERGVKPAEIRKALGLTWNAYAKLRDAVLNKVAFPP